MGLAKVLGLKSHISFYRGVKKWFIAALVPPHTLRTFQCIFALKTLSHSVLMLRLPSSFCVHRAPMQELSVLSLEPDSFALKKKKCLNWLIET